MYFLLHPISSLNHFVARLATDQITFLASIVLFIILAFNYKKPFWQSLDKSVSQWASSTEESFIKTHAEDFSIFGNAIFHILFSIILSIIFFLVKHKFSLVIAILFVLIFSWGFNRLLKLVYKRTRPEHMDPGIRRRLSYCFPSGHIMASIPIYFFSAVLLQGLIPFLPWYLIALFMSSIIVVSRIYLNHHYFTDVCGGIAMGIFCLNISIWFYFFIGLV
ncbi:MAG: phosphatase PAP2 family protein [Candidatus Melainabacteria bacterium]|nr:phosphatase PAP2 family protein [Candidatus Melainabacteria bacterium]